MIPRNSLHNLYVDGGEREFRRDSTSGVLKSLNHCHKANQAIIQAILNQQNARERDRIEENGSHFRRDLVVLGCGAVIAHGAKIFAWLSQMFQ